MKTKQNNRHGQMVKFPAPSRTIKTNVVYCADNLEVMRQMPSESIDLIYIDPPFGTQSLRKSKSWDNRVQGLSFYDSYGGGIKSYVSFMFDRLEQMHRLLKADGSIFVHLDYRAVHYIKCRMDEIFGSYKNLMNEIIWCFEVKGQRKSNYYHRTHNNILWYAKNKKKKFTPARKTSFEESTEKRWGNVLDKCGGQITYGDLKKYGKGSYEAMRKKGRIGKSSEVWISRDNLGYLNSWWADITPVRRKGGQQKEKEKYFYPTQKPEKLLTRIIETATKKGDIVADFFCGCGTTISTAEKLGRKWIGVDASKEASKVIRKRMARDHKLKIEISPLRSLNKAQVLRLNPFEFESYCVRSIGGIPNEKQSSDGGIDGKLIYDGTPIQVKKSSNVGRTVIDSFHKHLRKNGRGIIIALSFRKRAYEEANRLKLDEGKDLQLITLDKILKEGTSSVA